ncbi:hypothetical protein CMI47_10410 [Candidatus Pacearchaeota archaeon]|nr:hypothetical protein [Candidatus Pacearchaeota archaeon]|tara:strand:- start:1790 stop:4459 length:2670 start_codon:yes stop_codon:yes gene_type:complete
MYTSKQIKLISLNLLSGSTETFRTANGGYYEVVSASEGEYLEEVEYAPWQGYTEPYPEPLSPFLKQTLYNVNLKEEISNDVMIPNYRVPVRLMAEDSTVKDDNFWKIILLGGEFGGITYYPIYTDSVFENLSSTYTLPYNQLEANIVNYVAENAALTDTIQISYDYNQYVPKYENYINTLESDKLIPNMYLFKMYEVESSPGFPPETSEDVKNFVTLEGTYEGRPGRLLAESQVVIDRYNKDHISYEDSSISQYLSSSLVITPLSASTTDSIKNQFENIIFDGALLTDESNDSTYSTMDESNHMIPFYMTFSWEKEEGAEFGPFRNKIQTSRFIPKFMKTLKEIFTNQLDDLGPVEKTFVAETRSTSGSIETATYSDVISTQNTTYKSIDFLEMLIYAYNNFISTTDNCYFMGPDSFERRAVMDTTGSYRYYNTQASLDMITETISYLISEEDESGFLDADTGAGLEDLYDLSMKYNEVLAYRIEKVGGSGTGDSFTQNVIQNFWFFNTEDFMNKFSTFYDSQVKYNTDYTYNVYSYNLLIGPKYSFSDLRLTRFIGSAARYSGDTTSPYNCLEFYDPTTDEPIEQLYEADNELMESNEAATNAQITSLRRYMADFYLNYEPSLQLIEIPIFSKTLKIMDNVPNQVNIAPYQMMDASQKIGFTINYETYNASLDYPSTISSNDVNIKNDYLHGHDFLSSSYYPDKSVSRQRYIEIYRTEEIPATIEGFDGNQLQTLDLRDIGSLNTISSIEFLNTIRTNKKYYYVFRALNEQKMPGHLSEIYEAQLINDGGYLYSIFNILFEEDLEQEIFVNPSQEFKKIFELQPNITQLKLGTDEADFSQPANTQIENITVGADVPDTLWDKTFKVRLTSLKTGKKIDLNFTYNLRID